MSVYGDIKLRALLPVGREKRAYDMSNLRDDAVSSLLAGVGGALGGGARRHADISTRATSAAQRTAPGMVLNTGDLRYTVTPDMVPSVEKMFRDKAVKHDDISNRYVSGAAATGVAGLVHDATHSVNGHSVLTPLASTIGSVGSRLLLERFAPGLGTGAGGIAARAGTAALGNMAGRLGVRGFDALMGGSDK